jgi:hypothetical protein
MNASVDGQGDSKMPPENGGGPERKHFRWKRLLQLRLATLLLVITICCAVLGFRQGYIVPYVRQDAAVERIIDAGGAINYAPASPEWLGPVVGQDIYHRAVWVDLEHRRVDDELLTAFHDTPYVTNLYLAANPITDDGLRHVAHLQNLERLSLWRTGVTDEGLKRLVGMKKLIGLDLHVTAVSDEGLARLPNLTSLGEITLPSRTTDAGLAHLGRLPNLRVIKANGARCITPRGFRHLADCPVHLIEADWMQPLLGGELEHFAELPKLQSLPAEVVDCSDEQLQYLARMSQLRELSVSGSDLTDAGLVRLESLKRLTRLRVTGRISAAGLDSLRKLPQLERVHVTTELIGEEDLPKLLAGWGPQFNELVVYSPWFEPNPKWPVRPEVDRTPLNGSTKQRLITLSNGQGQLRIFASACRSRSPFNADGNVENLYISLSAAARPEDLRRLARWPHLRHLAIESSSDRPLKLDQVAECQQLMSLHLLGGFFEPTELGKLHELDQLNHLTLRTGRNRESLTQHLLQLKQLKRLDLNVPHLRQVSLLKQGLPGTRINLGGHPTRYTSFGRGNVTHLTLAESAIPGSDELGGLGTVKTLKLGSAVRLHDLSGLHSLHSVQELDVTDTIFATPGQWDHVGRCAGLSKLILNGSNVTDDALRQVGRLSSLLDLQLNNTPVTDRGITYLARLGNLLGLQLNRLDPQGGPWITDRAMPTIGRLPSLMQLHLFRTDVTDVGVQHLASLKHLAYLNLSGTQITNEGLRHLTCLEDLELLDLAYCKIDDNCLETLTKFRSLRYVNCYQTNVTRPAIDKLRLRHSRLRIQR